MIRKKHNRAALWHQNLHKTCAQNGRKNHQTGSNNNFFQRPGQYAERDETKRANSGSFPSNEQETLKRAKIKVE
jgi:hypothetical protein